MIEHIRTIGFKGFDIDEDIPQKVIYTGKNKSGKSTRAGAIAVVLYGYIPFSTAGKTPRAVLESFGQDSLTAVATIKGKKFGRKFSRNEAGKVSQVLQYNEKRTSIENFASMLGKAGAPKIADVAEFMKVSDTKKIDTLFDLFPNPELASIDTEIEKAKADVSRLEKKKSGAESTVVRLNASKVAIDIPAGSIAEVQSEINAVETQIVELEEQIKQAEIEEAEEKAKEEGRIEGERLEKERVEKEVAEKMVVEKETGISIKTESFLPSDPLESEISRGEQQIADFKGDNWNDEKPGEISEPFLPDDTIDIKPEMSDREFFTSPRQAENITNSIQRIMDALTGSGCNTCAALIVAKQELKKYRG